MVGRPEALLHFLLAQAGWPSFLVFHILAFDRQADHAALRSDAE